MRKRKMVKIIQREFPKEMAETVFNRIQPFLEEYTEALRLHNTCPWWKTKNKFDLKDLMFACYIQGLKDTTQVFDQAGINIDEIELDI